MPAVAISRVLKPFMRMLNFIEPVGLLVARIWVAYVFFISGLAKFQNWESTVMLFTNEYHVPILSPWIAAVLGTGLELILPILLLIGFGGRIIIFMFFVYNIVAVATDPNLWILDGRLALDQHVSWGLLLAVLTFHGSGKLSLDYLLRKRFGHMLK